MFWLDSTPYFISCKNDKNSAPVFEYITWVLYILDWMKEIFYLLYFSNHSWPDSLCREDFNIISDMCPVECKPNVLRLLEAAKLSWNFPIKYRSWNFITALTRSHYTVLFNFNNQFFWNSFKMCNKLHYPGSAGEVSSNGWPFF